MLWFFGAPNNLYFLDCWHENAEIFHRQLLAATTVKKVSRFSANADCSSSLIKVIVMFFFTDKRRNVLLIDLSHYFLFHLQWSWCLAFSIGKGNKVCFWSKLCCPDSSILLYVYMLYMYIFIYNMIYVITFCIFVYIHMQYDICNYNSIILKSIELPGQFYFVISPSSGGI